MRIQVNAVFKCLRHHGHGDPVDGSYCTAVCVHTASASPMWFPKIRSQSPHQNQEVSTYRISIEVHSSEGYHTKDPRQHQLRRCSIFESVPLCRVWQGYGPSLESVVLVFFEARLWLTMLFPILATYSKPSETSWLNHAAMTPDP